MLPYTKCQNPGKTITAGNTYEDTVGAGHGRAAALRAGTDTDDGDRAAGQPNEAVDIASVDAEECQDASRGCRASLTIANKKYKKR